jgi:hypothetical protein
MIQSLPDALDRPIGSSAERWAWEVGCGGGIEDGVEGISQEKNALGGKYSAWHAAHAETNVV